MKQLVLASTSPSRKEILGRTKLPFIVEASDYEEDMSLDLTPDKLAVHLALGKGRSVAKRHKNSIVLAADSFAVFNNLLLSKPHSNDRAKEMLTMLSGNRHSFITGYAIIDTDTGKERTGFQETKVYFRDLSNQEIDNYLAKENVLSKAGAYTIEGLGEAFIERIDGDYSNVMGLPLSTISQAIIEFGIELI